MERAWKALLLTGKRSWAFAWAAPGSVLHKENAMWGRCWCQLSSCHMAWEQSREMRGIWHASTCLGTQKNYRESRNHEGSMGQTSQLRNHTRFLPFSPSPPPPVFLCMRKNVMFLWFALFVNPQTLTVDQTAADAASRGLTDKITSVSFQPWMNPIIIPARNVAKNCTNIQILSPMPSWMVLMSL